METPTYKTEPTHAIHSGARIRVETKSGRGFAWATVYDEFEIAEQPKEFEPHRETGMRFFLAMTAFSTFGFNYRPKTQARYEVGTHLYAFTKNLTRLSRREEPHLRVWRQGQFIL